MQKKVFLGTREHLTYIKQYDIMKLSSYIAHAHRAYELTYLSSCAKGMGEQTPVPFRVIIKEENTMEELKIEYIALSEIKPYENNAKLHPEIQIEQIKKSINDFGFNDPIAVWKDNEIIEGHGRYQAALELGFETVPVIRLDGLTEKQRKAYTLVHNKLTMNTGFDFENLVAELKEIPDIDMQDFGFSSFLFDNEEEDFTPVEFDSEIEREYGENGLKAFTCIISCTDDEQIEWLKALLKEDSDLHRQYKCENLMKRFEET